MVPLPLRCFNCGEAIPEAKPICPYCFAVQREQFSREELFNYLEEYFPIKTTRKPKITCSHITIKKINYKELISLAPISFGISYYLYLLESLKALNDHWYFPHKKNEHNTSVDMFISTILLVALNILVVPFIQYFRYEKLRRHLLQAPNYEEGKPLPQMGKRIFWAYLVMNLFLFGSIAMFTIGGLSFVIDVFTVLDSSIITIIFFVAAALIFIGAAFIAFVLSRLEIRWHRIFTEHLQWHFTQRNSL